MLSQQWRVPPGPEAREHIAGRPVRAQGGWQGGRHTGTDSRTRLHTGTDSETRPNAYTQNTACTQGIHARAYPDANERGIKRGTHTDTSCQRHWRTHISPCLSCNTLATIRPTGSPCALSLHTTAFFPLSLTHTILVCVSSCVSSCPVCVFLSSLLPCMRIFPSAFPSVPVTVFLSDHVSRSVSASSNSSVCVFVSPTVSASTALCHCLCLCLCVCLRSPTSPSPTWWRRECLSGPGVAQTPT